MSDFFDDRFLGGVIGGVLGLGVGMFWLPDWWAACILVGIVIGAWVGGEVMSWISIIWP